MSKTSFSNHHGVQNQVGHQIVHGNLTQHHHYRDSNDIATDKRQRSRRTDANAQGELDDMILESLAFPEMTQRRRNIESPHFESCEWIFQTEEYTQWVTQHSGLLWIKGKPGAGKSTLMSYLYREIQFKLQSKSQDEICLEYFFTARGAPLEHSPLGMFRSLLNQIFYLDPNARTHLRTAYHDRTASFQNISWQWQQAELQALFTETIITSAQQHRIIIFIDALDEAGPQAARETARYFHTLSDKVSEYTAQLSICIACRHYPVPPMRQKALEVHVDQHNHEAIESYMRSYAQDFTSNSPRASNQYEKLLRCMCEMANGVFQWAYLVMPLVQQRIEDGDSFEQIQRWLPRLSTDLDHVYEYVCMQVIEDKILALRLFQWVCLASRPLSIAELRYAIAAYDLAGNDPPSEWSECPHFVENDTIMQKRIRAWSGGLIEVKGGESSRKLLVQSIHLSVNNFILRRGLELFAQSAAIHSQRHQQSGCAITPKSVDPVAFGHGQLYWCCLRYAAFAEAELSSSSGLSTRAIIRPSEALLDEGSPLLVYVVDNVVHHARNARGHRIQDFDLELELRLLPSILSAACVTERFFKKDRRDQPSCGSTILHIASAADLGDLAQYFLSLNFDVSAIDYAGQTALHIAAQCNSCSVALVLLTAGADVNAATYTGATALVHAAGNEDKAMFVLLLQEGASLLSEAGSESALYVAVCRESKAIIKLCIGAGADINARGGEHGNALQAASYNCSVEIVAMLLKAGADVNIQGGVYGNALQAASVSGSVEIVAMLLKAGADVNVQGGLYYTALQAASRRGSAEIAAMLLKAGAGVDAQGGLYCTALQAASNVGSVEIVAILLKAGGSVNTQGGYYGNALQAASYSYSVEIVAMLLEAGADINAREGEHGNALQAASSVGSVGIVAMLLKAGADINIQGGVYGNALQAASSCGSVQVAAMLLKAGADVNMQGGEYGNALQAASSFGSVQVAAMLLKAGADVTVRGGRYGNAMQAASHRGSVEVVTMLLKAGADVNMQGGRCGNALQAASSCGSVQVAAMLLKAGADVNMQGGEYGNALQAASSFGSVQVVTMLLKAGADINVQGGVYGNALQAASVSGSVEIVAMLLKAGADINMQGGEYGNALQAASSFGSVQVVTTLLKAGADVNIQGGVYGNALQAASVSGSVEVVAMLLRTGADGNLQGGRHVTALHAAIHCQSEEIVEMLLEIGVDVNVQTQKDGTALSLALSLRAGGLVCLLRQAGAI